MATGIVTVVGVANQHRVKDADYPTTIVYKTAAGDLECRSIARFRSAAIEPASCDARREQDEMVCHSCHRRWSVYEDRPCQQQPE